MRDIKNRTFLHLGHQHGGATSAAMISTLAVMLLVVGGLAYVFLSGGRTVSEFDFSNLPQHGQPDAPVTVVVIEDFRCGGCQQFHRDVIAKLESDQVESGMVQLRFAVLPMVREDSPDLAALALAYSKFHDVSYASVSTVLFEADSPRIELDQAESVLAERFGPLPSGQKQTLITEARKRVVEMGRYLINRDVNRVPSVVVENALLLGPSRELVLLEIERALQSDENNETS